MLSNRFKLFIKRSKTKKLRKKPVNINTEPEIHTGFRRAHEDFRIKRDSKTWFLQCECIKEFSKVGQLITVLSFDH